ncbi:hypothetical protein RCO48_34735 [Peribacillus frigoritolerans]|nr:hypothetical protein [Peribacillus frigoritolerans]
MDLSKMESAPFLLNKTPIAYAQFIEDVLVKYEPIIKRKGIGLAARSGSRPDYFGG